MRACVDSPDAGYEYELLLIDSETTIRTNDSDKCFHFMNAHSHTQASMYAPHKIHDAATAEKIIDVVHALNMHINSNYYSYCSLSICVYMLRLQKHVVIIVADFWIYLTLRTHKSIERMCCDTIFPLQRVKTLQYQIGLSTFVLLCHRRRRRRRRPTNIQYDLLWRACVCERVRKNECERQLNGDLYFYYAQQ